ncbi:hypothetical protein GCM10009779_55990 [Polymorphospora rubra]|uniref:Uncharacterized protein n=1 Tax=Polymorphospora rubra TaxID=338584 RepID=A0A810MYM2_9ACTN|nr:hypothetical protein Prubr_33820 [Polymorphospora rubra]
MPGHDGQAGVAAVGEGVGEGAYRGDDPVASGQVGVGEVHHAHDMGRSGATVNGRFRRHCKPVKSGYPSMDGGWWGGPSGDPECRIGRA